MRRERQAEQAGGAPAEGDLEDRHGLSRAHTSSQAPKRSTAPGQFAHQDEPRSSWRRACAGPLSCLSAGGSMGLWMARWLWRWLGHGLWRALGPRATQLEPTAGDYAGDARRACTRSPAGCQTLEDAAGRWRTLPDAARHCYSCQRCPAGGPTQSQSQGTARQRLQTRRQTKAGGQATSRSRAACETPSAQCCLRPPRLPLSLEPVLCNLRLEARGSRLAGRRLQADARSLRPPALTPTAHSHPCPIVRRCRV